MILHLSVDFFPCFPTRHWPQSGKPPRQQQKRASSKQQSATCQIFRDFFVLLARFFRVLIQTHKSWRHVKKKESTNLLQQRQSKHKPEVRIGQHHLAEMSAEMFSSELPQHRISASRHFRPCWVETSWRSTAQHS